MKQVACRGLLLLVIAVLVSCGGGGGGGASLSGAGIAAGGAVVPGTSAAAGTTGVGATGADAGSPGSGGSSASSAGTTSSTSTAAGGDDSGVGSGGTGVTTADATGIGSVDGFGSIFVNGVRYNTDSAVVSVVDASTLLIGATVKVSGSVNADFTSGVARQVTSAAELRGSVAAVDTGRGSMVILGTTVTTDASTVWADVPGLAAVQAGMLLQVWGLPAEPGSLRATRIEQRTAATPILTGTVQGLNLGLGTFVLGSITVDYSRAVVAGAIDAASLANGAIVRVRADAPPASGTLMASSVQLWNPVPSVSGARVQLGGVITNFSASSAFGSSASSSFSVLGTRVDASSAQLTGGPPGSLGNGVRVEVAGTIVNGVLQASKIKVRHVPGTGGPASFTLIGTVGNFVSPASFRVRGQPVDASRPGVVFINGTAVDLGNGAKVSVSGDQVIDGVLIANQLSFDR